MLQHPDRFSKSQQALPPTPISKWDITCVMYSLPPFMYDVTPQVITPRGHFIYLHMHTYSFCYYTYTPTKKTSCLRCNKWVFDWTITNPVSIFSAPSLETFSYNTDTLQSPARRRRRRRGTAVLLYSKSVFPRGITFHYIGIRHHFYLQQAVKRLQDTDRRKSRPSRSFSFTSRKIMTENRLA